MFNVTVIRLKDLIKYPIYFALIMVTIYFTTKYFFNENNLKSQKIDIGEKIKSILNQNLLYPIDKQLGVIKSVEEDSTDLASSEELIDENNEDADKEFMTYMLDTALGQQFGVVDEKQVEDNDVELAENQETNTSENEVTEQKEEEKKETSDSEVELASKGVSTEVVTKDPIKEAYTDKYNDVKIKNETDFKLSDEVLNPGNLDGVDKNNVLIFHTHTCESYTESEGYEYKASGNYRTTDLNYSVARVGDELTKYLTKYDFKVTHDKTYHDYPAYNGSYTRSLNTVSNLLKKNDSDIIIDLHRDAIGSNSSYAPTVKIGDDYCAQIMFVIRN